MAGQDQVKMFLETLKADPGVPDNIKKKADDVLGGPVYMTDVVIYRIVVIVLGATVLLTVAGGLGLAFLGSPNNYKIPPELIALGSAAVGALAGLLAPSPGQNKGS
jgi:hypothetical protein